MTRGREKEGEEAQGEHISPALGSIMAPIGLKAVVGESKTISVLFYSKTGCGVALLRANAFFFLLFL